VAIVFLGLGSNLGDREQNIRSALGALEEYGVGILKLSSIIESDPVGGPSQGLFFNAVAKAKTDISPTDLLHVIHRVEHFLGRVRSVKNGPRTIDIDILLYDDLKVETPELAIPHPRMWARAFVTGPLREIAPEVFSGLLGPNRKEL